MSSNQKINIFYQKGISDGSGVFTEEKLIKYLTTSIGELKAADLFEIANDVYKLYYLKLKIDSIYPSHIKFHFSWQPGRRVAWQLGKRVAWQSFRRIAPVQ